jgi:ribonucleoside-triphosphate reductase (thioredoxin)
MLPQNVTKRSGAITPFDITRIETAVKKCFAECETEFEPAVVSDVLNELEVPDSFPNDIFTPSVEYIQDLVELAMLKYGYIEEARAYIRYRDEHARVRVKEINPDTQALFDQSAEYFPSFERLLQFYDKYSRFNYELGRRETWVETVDRSVNFLQELSGDILEPWVVEDLRNAILNMEIMPSMRLLAMAGPAARRNNLALYNCSFETVDSLEAFSEAMLISMSGCGVGYSVEYPYIDQLPIVKPYRVEKVVPIHIVADTTEGWVDAYLEGLKAWFGGEDIRFDYSEVRKAGSILLTKGGRASGPEPLKKLLDFARNLIRNAHGRKLTSLECHSLMCMTGEAAVQGGVRRTAMIALYSWGDKLMRHCKDGDLTGKEYLWNSNNSEVWPDRKLNQQEVAEFILDMHRSRRGEPGIFSRYAANRTRPLRRQAWDFGTNPCGEIALRPMQLCNLSSVICRPDDTPATLAGKVYLASMVGSIQSKATYFPGMRPQWKENCEDERLLGVDLNGQMDCDLTNDELLLEDLAGIAVAANIEAARALGIKQSAAITCVKPSGNSSTLLGCSPGIHARWAPYYVRNMRIGAHSPVYHVLKEAGVPMSPENGQTWEDARTWVVHVPVKSPEGAKTRKDVSALEQLERWALVKTSWTEHNPSVTITYEDHELLDIMRWVYDNQEILGGIAFLPKEDFNYDQAPYQEISREEYEARLAAFPKVNFANIIKYESEDLTTAAQEIACSSGTCWI